MLDLIHTDICGPFTPPAIGGYRYFITFIDDFSCYDYVELIFQKSDSLEAFKAFKAKVDFQKGRKIKTNDCDKVASIIGDMIRLDVILGCLLDICKILELMLDIQC